MSLHPPRRRIGPRGLGASYLVIVALVLATILCRGWRARKIDGVSAGSWPLRKPAVSYLASRNLATGHWVREADLRPPDVSANLASALPDRRRFIGKYIKMMVSAGTPVTADHLSDSPVAVVVPQGRLRLRVPVDSAIVNRVNAGVRVWLTRGDTLIAHARVEHLICQSERCDARLMVDSTAVSHVLRIGTQIPRLGIVLPTDEIAAP